MSSTLASHPNIFLPKIHRPEPNFFHYSWKFSQVEWYQRTLFQDVGEEKAVGERSSLLLTSNVAAGRIKEYLPEIKLIFCLRNPIERAFIASLEGLEPLPFNEVSTAEGKWIEIHLMRTFLLNAHTRIHKTISTRKYPFYKVRGFGKKSSSKLGTRV